MIQHLHGVHAMLFSAYVAPCRFMANEQVNRNLLPVITINSVFIAAINSNIIRCGTMFLRISGDMEIPEVFAQSALPSPVSCVQDSHQDSRQLVAEEALMT